MEIRLKPELEELIQRDVQRGPYRNVEEFVEHAISQLHDREAWLDENRAEIGAKIEVGYAAARRGELIDDVDVRSKMSEVKRRHSAKSS
jgi:Arc/MetJ-type ribon-helix-helix transcriptional regulator